MIRYVDIKKTRYSVLDFLLFSNIFMSACAVAQGLITYHLIKVNPSPIVLGLLFTATLATYNFSLLINPPAQTIDSPLKRVSCFFKYYRLMIIVTIVALIVLIFLFFVISAQSRMLLIFLSILSLGYNMPLFSSGDKKYGLRNIPGLKPLLIALVWSISCVLIPISEARHAQRIVISNQELIILILKCFLFVGAMTTPYDIRDVIEDQRLGLKTIPVVFGVKKASLFCQALFITYLLMMILFRNHGMLLDFWAFLATFFITWWLIFGSEKKKDEYYYSFYLDGVFMLQYVMLLVFQVLL